MLFFQKKGANLILYGLTNSPSLAVGSQWLLTRRVHRTVCEPLRPSNPIKNPHSEIHFLIHNVIPDDNSRTSPLAIGNG